MKRLRTARRLALWAGWVTTTAKLIVTLLELFRQL